MVATKAIAIIDDETDLVDLFQEILEGDGFKVCAFTDPIQAYNHIQKNPNDYDLILSDYRMPRIRFLFQNCYRYYFHFVHNT